MIDAAGAGEDLSNVQDTFKALNFAFLPLFNPSANNMKDLAQAIAKYPFPKRGSSYRYIAFYYGGHGGISSSGDSILAPMKSSKEKEYVLVEGDIIRRIGDGQVGKCLLFFFDCCQSYAGDEVTTANPPGLKVKAIHEDSLVAHASSFGEKSFGSEKYGGVWTKALCKNLLKDERLVVILDDTNTEVKGKGQQCSFTSNLKQPVNLKGELFHCCKAAMHNYPRELIFIALFSHACIIII